MRTHVETIGIRIEEAIAKATVRQRMALLDRVHFNAAFLVATRRHQQASRRIERLKAFRARSLARLMKQDHQEMDQWMEQFRCV